MSASGRSRDDGSGRRRRAARRRRRLSLAACAGGVALLSATALGLALSSTPAPAQSDDPVRSRMLDQTIRYMQSHQRRDGCYPMKAGGASDPITATPWTALAIASAGVNPRDQYRPDGYATAWDCIVGAARQLTVTTDFERTLLVAVAACSDPRAFAGSVDLVEAIVRAQRPSGSFDRTVGSRLPSSPLNTTIFAILSLSAVPDPALAPLIARAVAWLVSVQNGDGSWPSIDVGGAGDNDMTGAALEALRAAGLAGPGAADAAAGTAVDRAVAWLRGRQLADGGFQYSGHTSGNSASAAWVAQGLWAIDQDPGQWRPHEGGPSILDFLASLQQDDGRIVWEIGDDLNPVWMTAYTLPAYSGRYLPFGCVEWSGRVPDPRNAPTPEQPRDGVGGGSGGTGGDGGGVITGGGGRGAPNFSRPRQGSKGSTVGGVRSTRVEQRRRRRARAQAEQERDAADNAASPDAERERRPERQTPAAPPASEPAPQPGGAMPDQTAPRRAGG
ncbi:prenyltransferase/squalene oxidase repeat-containing protein, partial [Conexibacter sp. CPCC 205706]